MPFSEPHVWLRHPGELIAAVPQLLGFYPEESLVRTDLPLPRDEQCLADQLLQHLHQTDTDEVIVAVIGGGSADPPDPPPREQLARRIAETLTIDGIRIAYCVWAETVRHGALWRLYGHTGPAPTVPDPHPSPLAAEVVLAGEVTFASRAARARRRARRRGRRAGPEGSHGRAHSGPRVEQLVVGKRHRCPPGRDPPGRS